MIVTKQTTEDMKMKNDLINEITRLELLRWIRSDNFGPNSEEVKQLDKRISELNAELLDYMVEEQEQAG